MASADALVIKCDAAAAGRVDRLAAMAAQAGVSADALHLHVPVESGPLHVFIDLDDACDDARRDVLAQAVARLLELDPATVRAYRLRQVFDRPGASAGRPAPFHYVVETNAADGWIDEIGRWYDDEHMPGLAAVPGCVQARRYLNHDGGPLSYACYDLEAPGVLGSPPWLAVRHTEWSSRVRPQFRDTLRTMFRVVSRLAP